MRFRFNAKYGDPFGLTQQISHLIVRRQNICSPIHSFLILGGKRQNSKTRDAMEASCFGCLPIFLMIFVVAKPETEPRKPRKRGHENSHNKIFSANVDYRIVSLPKFKE